MATLDVMVLDGRRSDGLGALSGTRHQKSGLWALAQIGFDSDQADS